MDRRVAPSGVEDAAATAEERFGRLVLVVGPSGAGKDTLIEAARAILAADQRFVFPRRVVTRPSSEAEDNVVADEAGFRAVAARGGFSLSWEAHGHLYGIPSAIVADLAAGRTVVINVSRTVIDEARRRWPDVAVVEVTAPADVLARRLAARARPSDGAGPERLARRFEPGDRPTADTTIDNGGELDTAIAAFLMAIVGSTSGSRAGPLPHAQATVTKPRYAIYFAPAPDTPLWRTASRVIGRDAATGAALPFPDLPPCDADDWADLTADPRRYGFHATLKAPFALAEEADEALLLDVARGFAAGRRGFVVPDLSVRTLGSFVALTPDAANADLDGLAADCVVVFEPFRAPLPPQERARRVAGLTDPRHVASVDRWGYPWVFEDFRFHMTLTGSLPEARRETVRARLAEHLGDVARPLAVDAISIFRQDRRDAPFRLIERIPFAV